MKFKFAKSLLVGSLFALGFTGLTACGDDSGSNSTPDSSSSGEEKLVLDSVSAVSPLDEGSFIKAEAVSDGKNGYNLRLQGNISTNSDEFDTEGYDGEDRVYYNVDSLTFDIGRINENGDTVRVGNLPVQLKASAFGKEFVTLLAAIDGEIHLNQDEVGCGDFVLYAKVYMSGDEEDTKKFAYTARLSTAFNLQCKVIESSSSAAVCTEMVADTVVLSNKVGGSLDRLNFATKTAENPDVILKIEERIPFFEAAANGVKIGKVQTDKEKGIEDGVLPTKACLENFVVEYGGENRVAEDGLENMAWYLVTTSSASYPFMVDKFMAQDDTKGDLTIIYFKKK